MAAGRLVIAAALVATGAIAPVPQAALATTIKPQVVHGVEGPSPDFDFLMALGDRRYYEAVGVFRSFCGGSLVSPTLVITAAHCVWDTRSSDLIVSTADSEGSLSGDGMRMSNVSAITIHPDYETRTQNNDIAVLTLRTPLTGVPTVQAVTEVEAATLTATRAPVSVAGWGAINSQPDWVYPTIYRIGNLVAFPESACGGGQPFTIDGIRFRGYGPNEVNSRVMLCAEGVSNGRIVDSCVGDSGGPLIGGQGSARRLVGVVSWGLPQCATRAGAGVYARVSAFTAFLRAAGVPFAPSPGEGPQTPTISRVVSTPTSLTVTVSPAATGAMPDSYTVTAVDRNAKESTCTVTTPNGGAGRCTIDGLAAAREYTLTAVAIAGDEVSEPSRAVTTQPLGMPSTPRIVYARAEWGGFAGFVVENLRGNGSPLTKRKLRCSSDDAVTRRTVIDSDGIALLSRLSPGVKYRCEAVVANQYGRVTSRPVSLVAK